MTVVSEKTNASSIIRVADNYHRQMIVKEGAFHKTYNMNHPILKEYADLFEAVKYPPCVSIILPLENRFNAKEELIHQYKIALGKITNELKANYPDDQCMPVIKKLEILGKQLLPGKDTRSIAVYASPIIAKTYYLNTEMKEQFVVDRSFEIRPLLMNKKLQYKYLLLILSGEQVKLFQCTNNHLERMHLGCPESIDAYRIDAPEKIANFSDEHEKKEALLTKMLAATDHSLKTLLGNGNPQPLFVMGVEKTIGQFKKLTHNSTQIVEYVQGNFIDHSPEGILRKIEPILEQWRLKQQEKQLQLFSTAANGRKTASGITAVWKEVKRKNCKLLLVEKNYRCAASIGAHPEILEVVKDPRPFNVMKDAVDDIIEQVLECGGDISFMEDGSLEKQGRIALIEYFKEPVDAGIL